MSFADRDGVIWLDGELVPWREAKTPCPYPHPALWYGRI